MSSVKKVAKTAKSKASAAKAEARKHASNRNAEPKTKKARLTAARSSAARPKATAAKSPAKSAAAKTRKSAAAKPAAKPASKAKTTTKSTATRNRTPVNKTARARLTKATASAKAKVVKEKSTAARPAAKTASAKPAKSTTRAAAPAKKAAVAKPVTKAPAQVPAAVKAVKPESVKLEKAPASTGKLASAQEAKAVAQKVAGALAANPDVRLPLRELAEKIQAHKKSAAAAAAASETAKSAAAPIRAEAGKSSPVSKPLPLEKAAPAEGPKAEVKPVEMKSVETKPVDKTPAAAPKAAKPAAPKPGFKPMEFIVYPAHGVGQIIAIEEQEVAGFKLELYVISFVKDKMILKVPTPKSVSVGMRKLAGPEVVKKALATLTGRARVKRTMWSRRAQEYEAKINSGDLVAIAEVVRDLYRSDAQPEQSYSERQLYEAALDRVAREIAVVQKLTETESLKLIDSQLQKGPRRGKTEDAEADAAGDGEDGDIEEAA